MAIRFLPIDYAAVGARLFESDATGLIVVYRDPTAETSVRPNVALDPDGHVSRYDKQAAEDPELQNTSRPASWRSGAPSEICRRRKALFRWNSRSIRNSSPQEALLASHCATLLRHRHAGAVARDRGFFRLLASQAASAPQPVVRLTGRRLS